MRRTLPLLLLIVLLHGPGAQAQKLQGRMVDRYAEVFDHAKAAEILEKLDSKGKATPEDLRRLAQIYQKMGQPKKAEHAYTRLMATGKQSPDDILAYADQLRANGNYTTALEWYGNHAAVKPEDQRSKVYLNDPGFFERTLADSSRGTVRAVPINSSEADLGMSVLDELLLFSSARGEGAGGRRTYAWDGEHFLNLYSALLKGESAEEPMVMRKDVNSRYHDGTVSYDAKAKRMYYTRNNIHYGVLSKSERGELNLGIYYTDVVTGEFGEPLWSSLIMWEHNDAEFSNGHPAVSPGGERLFFVSDRPGGFGGTDIWFCEKLGETWGAPQNVGPKVNTSGNEMYPFLRADSTLFFSSNGHAGLGGMDLFSTRLRSDGPGKVFHLGYPMNTRYNDHGIMLINDSTGFFSSDRPGGMGSDDIYGCTIRPPMVFMAGRVIDSVTRQPIEGASIVLKDGDGQHVKRYTLESAEGGRFSMNAEYHERYLLVANMNGYYQVEMPVNTDEDPLNEIVVEMVKYDYAAVGTIFHGETGKPLDGVAVVLTDGNGNKIAESITDATGRYQFPLKPESDYRIKADKEGFFKQSAKITTKGKPSAAITTDMRLFPLVVDQVVRLDNIFYDFNKADIREDAALELDKLVATLQENATVKIELSSHTDCRGKDAYNLSLSQRRAKSAVDYIISKGIAKDRVVSKGYGKSKPSEDCKCEECTDEQHQNNRRTEFKVLAL
ncbi:MAG: carboxypeptidase regulatory-like domain-containing protein [Flavobacteriales bacterium]